MGTKRQEVKADHGEDGFCLSASLCLEQRCREPEVFCLAPGRSLEASAPSSCFFQEQ